MCLLLQIIPSLSLPDRALLVSLFYQIDNSAIVALRKFWTLKGIRKGPLTVKNLRIIWKRIKLPTYTLDQYLSCFQKQWICPFQMSKILFWVSYGIIRAGFNLSKSCFQMILRLDTGSVYNVLLALRMIQNALGVPSRQMKHTFIWTFLWILTTAAFGNQKICVQPYWFLCTCTKSNDLVWIYYSLYSSILIFFRGIKFQRSNNMSSMHRY